MSAGLAALLDDVAALARAAAASVDDVAAGASRASMKAAGVIVDDAAVTPRYVQGFRPERELPMIKRIAAGSLRNKLLLILPAALLLSELLPWLLTPILMLGGTYLCYEGAEKLWELSARTPRTRRTPVGEQGPEHEDELVGGAIRTDFILSAEIMVISLNEVADEPFLSRALILVVVALAITAGVYGAVALIVKMDDVGLQLAQTRDGRGRVVRARAGAGACRSSCRCSRRSGSPRCSGSAGTSCWSASTSWASRCPTTRSTISRRTSTTLSARSAASAPG